MFTAITNMFTNGILVIMVFLALVIRLAVKNPGASGGIARVLFGLMKK